MLIETERLILREWKESDREPWAELCADPEVMEHFPSVLMRQQSDAMFNSVTAHFAEHGFGLWAVEVKDSGDFIGFTGLKHESMDVPHAPCVEIGWRLARSSWGQGYATEAANAALRTGFEVVGLDEIFSWTVPANTKSIGVMKKIGLSHDASGDFDHPRMPAGHPLRPHVLYRLSVGEWRAKTAAGENVSGC